jgi:hypothetical protein
MRNWQSPFVRGLLSRRRERTGGTRLRGVIGSIFLLLVALFLFIAFWPRGSVFSVDVKTEIIRFDVTNPRLSEWPVGGAKLWTTIMVQGPDVAALDQHAILTLNEGASVEIQRHGVGPVRVKIDCDGCDGGFIETSGNDVLKLGSSALLVLAVADSPILLPFSGHAQIGDDVASRVSSILLSGTVKVVEEELITKGHYIAREQQFDTGDMIELFGLESGTPSSATVDGFVRVEPMAAYSEAEDAMRVIAHGEASYVEVIRLGTAGYEVRVHPWSRFLNDPALAILFAVLASLALIIEVVFKLSELPGSFIKEHQDGSSPD